MGDVIDATEKFNARRAASDKKRGKPSGDRQGPPVSDAELRAARLRKALEDMKKK